MRSQTSVARECFITLVIASVTAIRTLWRASEASTRDGSSAATSRRQCTPAARDRSCAREDR